MKKIKLFVVALISFGPIVAFAQASSSPGVCDAFGGASRVICSVNQVLKGALPLLISLGVIYFVWGVVQYFIGDSEEAKTKGRDRIIYGIIGLAVIISIWGLVTLVTDTLGVGGRPPTETINNLAPQGTGEFGCFSGFDRDRRLGPLLNYATCTIASNVIPFMFALAVAMFIWGAIKFFIINADEESKREQGKQFMIWGIIAIAVMISIWGLVNILGATFGVDTGVLPTVRP
jgi:hypothetical protein